MFLSQSHPWFKDVMWDQLYEMEAAFKPEVNGELDTQNFMKFDEVNYYYYYYYYYYYINVIFNFSL